MRLETQYATALYEAQNPTVKKLREALQRRGHEKLLPRIFAEYAKLALGAKRLSEHKKVTPERERTRVLLELYRKLIHTN